MIWNAHITPKTKLMIINSPSNPSGAVLRQERIRADLRTGRGARHLADDRRVLLPLPLRTSEPFSIAALPGAKDNVMVAGSLSKTYAMTGWRIGFVLAPRR